MALLLAWMLPLAVEDAATEGKKVIKAMLIVGLVFVGVIALGQLTHWARHRRR
jgi:hypothetical protein